jgi:hypothetical protein
LNPAYFDAQATHEEGIENTDPVVSQRETEFSLTKRSIEQKCRFQIIAAVLL